MQQGDESTPGGGILIIGSMLLRTRSTRSCAHGLHQTAPLGLYSRLSVSSKSYEGKIDGVLQGRG